MLIRVLIAALVIFLAMVAVRDGRVLRSTGLLGSCSNYGATSDGAQWEGCRSGKLAGFPNLSGKGCQSTGFRGGVEVWSCPAPITSGPRGL